MDKLEYLPSSLRDQFAIAALPAVIEKCAEASSFFDTKDTGRLARCAYRVADAMLLAREAKV